MPQPQITDNSVQINGKSYRLARPGPNKEAYTLGSEDEPPYTQGVPAMVSDPAYTWHLGGLKSRQGIPGTTEYGQNTDGRWPFQLMPSALIHDLTLTSSSSTPLAVFEALGYVFVVTARRVYRIDPATDTVVLSKDFGSDIAIMGLRWETDLALVTTSAATQSLWSLAVGGIVVGGPDTWSQTADVAAYRIAAGINRLYKVNKTGELRNCSTGLNPLVNANWADQVQVGETSTLPTGIVAYERTVFVGKPEGMFGVGDDGFGLPLIKRMARETSNCLGMSLFDPYVLVPHIRGLIRYVPGIAEDCGIEREMMNESPVQGRWQAFASDGAWIYGCLAVGSNTYIMAARERRGTEAGFGPLVWDTWLYIAAASKAAWVSALSTNPRLYFGNGNNVSYVQLASGPGAVEYAQSGKRFSYRYRFDDRRLKDFQKVEAEGEAVDANTYWSLYYSVDGGAFSNTDRDGNAMRVNSEGLTTLYLPTTAVGRNLQLRWDYTGAGTSTPGKLRSWEAFAVPQSRKVRVAVMYFQLEANLRHGYEIEQRSALEQLNDLQTLSESATPIVGVGPWSADAAGVYGQVRKLRILETTQERDEEPTFLVEVGLQLREEG